MKTEKNILIAFLLNICFSIFELIGGLFTGSIAIISDSIHDFGDAISIGLSLIMERKSKKQPDDKYTYGYIRYSSIGATITTLILIIGSIVVLVNSIMRLIHPTTINYNGMIIIAIFGFVINFIAAYFTKEGDSINQKSVNLHMLEDVFNWIIVLIGAIIMRFTNISIIDPIMSILVALFILISALKNFKLIIDLFLEKTPKTISIPKIKNRLLEIKNIEDVHHIHIWSIDGINNYATMHVVCKDNSKTKKDEIKEILKEFKINHSCIEFENVNETCDDKFCKL